MGNFKVRVNNEAESREIQNILESIGFRKLAAWRESGSIGGFIWTDSDMTFCDNKIRYFDESPREEINLPELRAMVKPMKEYLVPQNAGGFMYKKAYESKSIPDSWIEIPKGAVKATFCNDFLIFWKDDFFSLSRKNGDTDFTFNEKEDYGFAEYMDINDDAIVIWQRESDQEEPFLTTECTLNDQYAEIKQVRQHQHYFIDVSDVDEIDFYEIALRYNVTDPCIQHILKKRLAVGQRGQKDFHHDLKDIYDTAKRMLDVHGLDS